MDKEVFAYGSETATATAVVDGDGDGGDRTLIGAAYFDRPRRGWLVPILIGALVFALVLAGTFALLWVQSSDTTPDEVAAFLSSEVAPTEARTRELIDLLMNYDATNLDERVEQIRAIATAGFREDYDELIQQGLGQALEEASASSRGQIVSGPDVSFRSPSEAVAIARVSQTTQSSDNPEGQTYLYVLKVTLIKTPDKGWLAGEVEILSEELS